MDYRVITVFAGAALTAGRIANRLPAAGLRRLFGCLILAVAVGVAATRVGRQTAVSVCWSVGRGQAVVSS